MCAVLFCSAVVAILTIFRDSKFELRRRIFYALSLLLVLVSFDLTAAEGKPSLRLPTETVQILKNESNGPIPLVILGFDLSQPLRFEGESSNPALISTNGFKFERNSITITPETNRSGSATITVAAFDANGATVSGSFEVEVLRNTRPTISPIADDTRLINYSPDDIVQFTVEDAETPAAFLRLSAASSNPELVPPQNVQFGGSGSLRLLLVIPAPETHGRSIITVMVTDSDGATASRSFVFDVLPLRNPPTISNIPDQLVNENQNTGPLPFRVQDMETAAGFLELSASSSNPTLVPAENIVFSGIREDRTVTAAPARNARGTALITLTVRDTDGWTARTSFQLTVLPGNQPPVIGVLPDVTTQMDTESDEILFTVSDDHTPAAQLKVSGASSNPTLLPNANIVFGGSRTNRTIAMIPARNRSGSAIVTISVTDAEGLSASRNFHFTVERILCKLTIASISDQTTEEDMLLGPIPLKVSRGCGRVFLTGSTSNPSLVPSENIFFSGTDIDHGMIIIPTTNQFGTAVITILAATSDAALASLSFNLTVRPRNDPPTIAESIPQQFAGFGETIVVPVRVNDVDHPLDSLRLTAATSDSVLVSNVVIAGAGPNRIIALTTTAPPCGIARITATITDPEGASASTTFEVFVDSGGRPNHRPQISAIPDLTTTANRETETVQFIVRDDFETPPDQLRLSVTSSNPTLVAEENVRFSGSGTNRSMSIIPAQDQIGTATVTITVADSGSGCFGSNGLSASTSFHVTVIGGECVLMLSSSADQVIHEDEVSPLLPFQIVGCSELAEERLTLSAESSNAPLISPDAIIFGGTGLNRTIVLKPALNQSGSAIITIIAIDPGGLTDSNSFTLTVLPVNDPPVADSQLVSVLTNSPQPIILTAGDVENDPLTFEILEQPQKGTLTGAPPNLIYTPKANAVGTDNFTFRANDGKLDSSPATVSILISETPVLVLGNPRVARPSPSSRAEVTFDIAAPVGASHMIEASSDWLTWTPVAVHTNVTGNMRFHEEVEAKGRFYRAKLIR